MAFLTAIVAGGTDTRPDSGSHGIGIGAVIAAPFALNRS